MLAMARALMSKPKLIMMDEPSMGLSPILVRVVIQHFSKNTVISMVLGHPNSEITCIPPS